MAMTSLGTAALLAASVLAAGTLIPSLTPVAEAIVGRPATPGSVAGVARRTARRTTVVVAATRPIVPPRVVVMAPRPTAVVAVLPARCASAGALFRCGGAYYRPYMHGTTVVYGVVSGP